MSSGSRFQAPQTREHRIFGWPRRCLVLMGWKLIGRIGLFHQCPQLSCPSWERALTPMPFEQRYLRPFRQRCCPKQSFPSHGAVLKPRYACCLLVGFVVDDADVEKERWMQRLDKKSHSSAGGTRRLTTSYDTMKEDASLNYGTTNSWSQNRHKISSCSGLSNTNTNSIPGTEMSAKRT
eukprot:3569987-Rhodomonas_salina.1